MSAAAFIRAKLPRMNRAGRDLAGIGFVTVVLWYLIERLAICDAFFDWVAANPEYEVDSVLIVLIFSAFGSAFFAWRRYREMKAALEAKENAESSVRKMAYEDPLTGLPNRRALLERLDSLTKTAGPETNFTLTILDLDKFKIVNDFHGHCAGDALLIQAGKRVIEQLGRNQEAYRLGGDEFAIISLPPANLEHDLKIAMTALLAKLSEPFYSGKYVHHIGSSAGSALFPRDGLSAALLRAADIAMYKAKEGGGGHYEVYTDAMDSKVRERSELEAQIRSAIATGEFIPHYQPIVELPSGKICGFEMLARWRRCDGSLIGPDTFIPVAEETGMINDLTLLLLEQFCIEARNWPEHLTVAINLSAVQFKDAWLGENILAVLLKHGIAPRRLAVEITETAIVANEEAALRTIISLRNQGVSISLDDFGTGYSSLHYLRAFPFDKLKIDRSFILSLFNADSEKIVSSIIGLANNLGLTIVAEGIESQGVADKLATMGCTLGQGYHFGRPADAQTTSRLIEDSIAKYGAEAATILEAEQLVRGVA